MDSEFLKTNILQVYLKNYWNIEQNKINQKIAQKQFIISQKNKINDLQQMNEELINYISNNLNNQNNELSANSTGKKKLNILNLIKNNLIQKLYYLK